MKNEKYVACSTHPRQENVRKFCSEHCKGRDPPRRKYNIKVDVTEIGWEDVEWIYVACDMAEAWEVENTVVSVRVSYVVTNSVTE